MVLIWYSQQWLWLYVINHLRSENCCPRLKEQLELLLKGFYLFCLQPVLSSVPPRPVTPEKFTVPHICARFGPGGQLIKVLPNLPSEGQPALVEIHSMEVKTVAFI